MKFEEIRKIVGSVPIMPPEEGKMIYDFILATERENILELGFAHGTSSCYIAAALDELGRGKLVTIDLREARDRDPNILQLLERSGLGSYVTPIFSEVSYTWELKKILEEHLKQGAFETIIDFCFLDGVHAWEPDALAFYLAELLLKPGAWFLFDDIDWTFAGSPGMRDTDWIRSMPTDFQTEPHVEHIFQLLVAHHPNMTNLRREGSWAWAQKRTDAPDTTPSQLEAIYTDQRFGPDAIKLAKRAVKKILGM